MPRFDLVFACVLCAVATFTGCSRSLPADPARDRTATGTAREPIRGAAASVQADINILFVGNSHTTLHDLPQLVCKMIEFLDPGGSVAADVVGVAFLEDTARDARCKQLLESRSWNYVVLQAQKISSSGRYEYSRQEGIELARRAKARGAEVFFFSEWGRRGVAGEGPRYEKVYQEMAHAAAAGVVPIGAAWDIALAQRPELPLHDPD